MHTSSLFAAAPPHVLTRIGSPVQALFSTLLSSLLHAERLPVSMQQRGFHPVIGASDHSVPLCEIFFTAQGVAILRISEYLLGFFRRSPRFACVFVRPQFLEP